MTFNLRCSHNKFLKYVLLFFNILHEYIKPIWEVSRKKATIDEILIDLQKVIDKLSQKILRDKNEIR